MDTLAIILSVGLAACIALIAWRRSQDQQNSRSSVIVLTGAAGGVGSATAERLLLGPEARRVGQLCATLVLVDRPSCQNRLEALHKSLRDQGASVEIVILVCDLRLKTEIHDLALKVEDIVRQRSALAQLGTGDQSLILINNAGCTVNKRLVETSDEELEEQFNVNVMSHMWLFKALYESETAKLRHVITVSSLVAFVPTSDNMVAYASSKAAARSLNDSLRLECYSSGIKFSTVCPGHIRTAMFSQLHVPSILSVNAETVAAAIVRRALIAQRQTVFVPTWMGLCMVRISPLLLPESLDTFIVVSLGRLLCRWAPAPVTVASKAE